MCLDSVGPNAYEFCAWCRLPVDDPDHFADEEHAMGAVDPFVPSSEGCRHVLSDGMETHVRLAFVAGRYEMQWLLPDRKVDIPESHDLAMRFPDFCRLLRKHPHQHLKNSASSQGRLLELRHDVPSAHEARL